MMNAPVQCCAECGSELPPNVPAGLCPHCALQSVLNVVPAESPSLLRSFGDYELLEEIARGGMGIVYKARQVSLDRIVAVKLLLLGQYASEEFIHRFRIEASAAASLQHPNIVAIHEVGVHQGQHYFAMDFVDGPDLAQIVRDGPLLAKRAASYVKTIAEAIHFAHSRRILHRDLKPSNVLIDSNDQPRVTDFGLAKNLANDSDLTLTGKVLGSPSFMPPEQALGDRGKMAPASDIYSLGAILYHALTGRPPFVGETLHATLQQVESKEPVAPRLLTPSVPIDLETVCLKCLEKEPAKRFQTAQELADELNRFLRDEPIHARPVSGAERAWRWCRRKPVVASLSAATALLLLTVTIGLPIALLLIKAEQNTTRQNLYAADMSFVQQAIEWGDFGRARQFLGAHVPRHGHADLRGFEWRHLWWNSRSDELATLQEAGNSVFHVSFSPDGRWLAANDKVWEASSSQPQLGFHPHPRFLLPTNHSALAFAPNGELLITTGNELKRWDPLTRREILLLTGEKVMVFAFSRTGKWLATGSDRGMRLWDATTWTGLTNSAAVRFESELWKTLAFSADEQWLTTSTGGPFSRVSVLRFWSVPALEPLPAATNVPDIITVAVSPDGREFYTGSVDGTLRVWDAASRTELEGKRVKRHHRTWISRVVSLPDGKLVTSGADRSIHLSEPGKPAVMTLHGHTSEIWSLAVSPDGRTIATGDFRGAVKIWSIPSRLEPKYRESLSKGGGRMHALGLSADGQVLATLTDTGLKFWNLQALPVEEIQALRWDYDAAGLAFEPVSADGYAAISSDFEYFAVARKNQPTEIWDIKNRKVSLLERSGPIAFPLFSPDGKLLVTMSASNVVALWDPATKQNLTNIITAAPIQTTSVPFTFSRDGETLGISLERQVLIWDVRLRRSRTIFRVPRRLIIALSSDGRLLATGAENNLVLLYDARTGSPLGAPLEGHVSGVEALAFSPDGRTLFSAADDSRLWHIATRRTMLTRAHSSYLVSALFSDDARVLVTGEIGQTIQIWHAPTIEEIESETKLTKSQ